MVKEREAASACLVCQVSCARPSTTAHYRYYLLATKVKIGAVKGSHYRVNKIGLGRLCPNMEIGIVQILSARLVAGTGGRVGC